MKVYRRAAKYWQCYECDRLVERGREDGVATFVQLANRTITLCEKHRGELEALLTARPEPKVTLTLHAARICEERSGHAITESGDCHCGLRGLAKRFAGRSQCS